MSDVRDKAEKLIRLSSSNHENEANMAARAACKLILDNGLSLHEQSKTPLPRVSIQRPVQIIRNIVVKSFKESETYMRGFDDGKKQGYQEGFEAAPKALPPPPISLDVVIPEFLVKP